jgi:DNA polymerase III gamma/tau subunit
MRTLPFAIGFLIWFSSGLLAQDPDTAREIQEIAKRVDEQMQAIDRLLLESSKPGSAEGQKQPKASLKSTLEQSAGVEQSLEELILKLTQMKNQSQSSSQDQQDDQQKQPQQQKDQGQKQEGQSKGQGQKPRDNQNPDFMQQRKPGEEPGQQQDPQQDPQGKNQPQKQGKEPGEKDSQGQPMPPGSKPDGTEKNSDSGQNRNGKSPADPDTAANQRGDGDGQWGQLQPYVNFLKNRGSPPKVPEKFRHYWEAYLKSQQNGAKGDGGK